MSNNGIHLNQKITAHGIINFQLETGLMSVSSALVEKNQQQFSKFYKTY